MIEVVKQKQIQRPTVRHSPRHPSQLLHASVMTVGVAEPIATIPQIIDIWGRHKTAGVSLPTWAGYTVAACVWLAYGISLRDKPLIITSALWIVMNGAVAVGVLLS